MSRAIELRRLLEAAEVAASEVGGAALLLPGHPPLVRAAWWRALRAVDDGAARDALEAALDRRPTATAAALAAIARRWLGTADPASADRQSRSAEARLVRLVREAGWEVADGLD